eukprot:TRINITY_DN4505_c0_g1_i6.p1 TRINITY_DN4505_c0_g1~~TRINITY_DN4505_c0_g1_i6.p1  ORF type:complete len:1140 (-),score=214.44 TRINITY_DN4505_c0_g1_i6:109-3528(-)
MDVAQAIEGKSIFLTGGTGFVGKVFLETVLRELPGVQKIFLLVRPDLKNNIKPEERLASLLAAPLFDRVRQERPDFAAFAREKIFLVSGDMVEENLGLSGSDMAILEEEIEIVFHLAATINFHERLDLALKINVLAPLKILEICKKMKRLKAFVHVSTAYVNSNKLGKSTIIEEKLYPLSYDTEDVVQTILNTPTKKIEKLTQKLLGTYPNTYTFTKSLGEHLLVEQKEHVRLIILRPTIIGCTADTPFPGWTDTVSAAGAIYLYTGLGILKIIPGAPDNIGDLVPCDYVVNMMLSVAAYHIEYPDSMDDVPIYHAGTSASNPQTWGLSGRIIVDYFQRNLSKKSVSTPSVNILTYPEYRAQFFLKYQLPSRLYSAFAKMMRSEFHQKQARRSSNIVERCHMLTKSFRHFIENEWIFQSQNGDKVLASMNPQSLERFNFSNVHLDWHAYLNYFCWGLQKFILKEDDIKPPSTRIIKYHRILSRNLTGINPIHKKTFPDLQFALAHSRNIKIPASAKHNSIKNAVLSSQRVLDAIEKVSESKGVSQDLLVKKSKEIVDNMGAKLQMPVIRFMAWFFRKVWRNLYDHISVNEEQIEKLRELMTSGKPIVIIPSHRSYTDFLLMSFLFYAYDLPVPHIAAGEDFLKLKFVTALLRRSGAFFLRRSFRGDHLYLSIFTEYVQKLLVSGFPLEFFIEGTRSRSGKLLQPKMGLLSMITETFFSQQCDDIILLPVNINYERIIEGEVYPNELLGEKKRGESLEGLIRGSYIFKENWGKVSVKISDPISLKQYAESYCDRQKISDHLDPFTVLEHRKYVNRALAHQIVYDINKLTIWPGSALVAAILLTYRLGISQQKLVDQVQWLMDEILKTQAGCEDWIIDEDPQSITNNALKLLEPVIVHRKNMIQPSTGGIITLAFYRNKIVHAFALEGFLACSLASFGQEACLSSGVELESLLLGARFISDLLNIEFVYKPDKEHEDKFDNAIESLISRNIFTESSSTIKISSSPHAHNTFHFLCNLFWPFIESYWICFLVIYSLKPDGISIQHLIQRMQWLAETLYAQNKMSFQESCSLDTLSNAIRLFGRWGVISVNNEQVMLGKKYRDNEDLLEELLERITRFRKVARGFGDGGLRGVIADFPIISKL